MRNIVLLLVVLLCFGVSVSLVHAGCVKKDIDDTSPGIYEDSDGDVQCGFSVNLAKRMHPPLPMPVESQQNTHFNPPATIYPVYGHADALSRHHVAGHAKPTILASSLVRHAR
jgi:hypothetical protein